MNNPFGNSRVDNPFQNFPDIKNIYQDEFNILTKIVDEIKADENHQSRGLVVLGEPGSGKTHLMMRLARERLNSNRLLYIRQPNNPKYILYHIYCRMIESFVEKIPESDFSQLEYLLSKSFSKIIINIIKNKNKHTQKDKYMLNVLLEDHLNVYKKIGNEGTTTKLKNWEYLEKKTIDWWNHTYGFGGYAPSIVKGLIKYCSYSNEFYKELVRRWLSGQELSCEQTDKIKLDSWSEDISLEDFSFEAITVLSKLSISDEPLIIIFDQLEGLKFNYDILVSFGDTIKEILTQISNSLIIFNLFPNRFEHFKTVFDDATTDRMSQYIINLKRPSDKQLLEVLKQRAKEKEIELDSIFTSKDIDLIIKQKSIRNIINTASNYFRHKTYGVELPIEPTKNNDYDVKLEIENLKKEINKIKEKLSLSDDNKNQTENSDVKDIRIIEYIKHQNLQLKNEYNKKIIISDNDDIGKLTTICDTFNTIKVIETNVIKLGQRLLPEHILIKRPEKSYFVGFLNVSGNAFTTRIKNFNEIVKKYNDVNFRLFRDERKEKISSKVALSELDFLSNTSNGKFIIMSQENRVLFEVIYKTIIDICNKDFEADLTKALNTLTYHFKNYWLMEILR